MNHLLSDEGSTLTFDSALGTNVDPRVNYSCMKVVTSTEVRSVVVVYIKVRQLPLTVKFLTELTCRS